MKNLRVFRLILGVILATGSLHAHFVWVALETQDGSDPQAHVYFSESVHMDSAEFLDRLTRLKAWYRTTEGKYASLKLRKVERDDDGWLASDLPSGPGSVEAECLYGVFSHGDKTMLLHYYAKSLRSNLRARLSRSEKLDLDVSPRLANGRMQLSVFWKSQPVEGVQVIVSPPKGNSLELKTDGMGRTSLKAPAPGRYEIRARWIEQKDGEFENQKYDETRHYSTVTFDAGTSDADQLPANAASRPENGSRYADLPRGHHEFRSGGDRRLAVRLRWTFWPGASLLEHESIQRTQPLELEESREMGNHRQRTAIAGVGDGCPWRQAVPRRWIHGA